MNPTLKSIGALLAGIFAVFATSTLTDLILENNGWMQLPFGNNPLWVMLIVVVYRNLYVVLSSYIVARLAPSKPMKHVMIFAAIGFALGTLGAIVMWHEPPHWYPISLIILGVPCSWLGGKLHTRNLKQNAHE